MEVVYLFCESAVVRVPFAGGDQRVRDLLVSQHGIWDDKRYEFIFVR